MSLLSKVIPFVTLALLCQPAFAQTVETAKKPAAITFKNAAGATVTSVPVDTNHGAVVVKMVSSPVSNTTYVLTAGKSKERSLSAVNLSTLQVDRVIPVGPGKRVDLLMSQDGSRIFCYTLSGVLEHAEAFYLETAHLQKAGGSSAIVTVIDAKSNSAVATYDLLHNPGLVLPKSRFFETFLSPTSDGGRLVAEVDGLKYADRPLWQRIAVFSGQSTRPDFVFEPGKPVASVRFSQDEKFLFVAGEDRKHESEEIYIVNLANGTSVTRAVDDPPTRHEELGAFLLGAPPSGVESSQGIWIFTRKGLRFISETGEMGNEIALSREEKAFGTLSQDRTHYFLAIPDEHHHSGVLEVVDLKKGTTSDHNLTDAPTKLIRLGSDEGLWVMGRQELRPISEAGELGDRPILLNKPRKTEEGDTNAADVFINGYPGETIRLGGDHAALLITKGTGESLHRVALLDLKQLQLNSVITTMSHGEQMKIAGGRFMKMMGEAALEGAVIGAISGGAGVPLSTFNGMPLPPPPKGLANEFLAASPDGGTLYVLDTDDHQVTVIDVKTDTVVKRIPVDKSTTLISIDAGGKHLLCAGVGFLRTVDLEPGAAASLDEQVPIGPRK